MKRRKWKTLHGLMQEENKIKRVDFSIFIFNHYWLMKAQSLGVVWIGFFPLLCIISERVQLLLILLWRMAFKYIKNEGISFLGCGMKQWIFSPRFFFFSLTYYDLTNEMITKSLTTNTLFMLYWIISKRKMSLTQK